MYLWQAVLEFTDIRERHTAYVSRMLELKLCTIKPGNYLSAPKIVLNYIYVCVSYIQVHMCLSEFNLEGLVLLPSHGLQGLNSGPKLHYLLTTILLCLFIFIKLLKTTFILEKNWSFLIIFKIFFFH